MSACINDSGMSTIMKFIPYSAPILQDSIRDYIDTVGELLSYLYM